MPADRGPKVWIVLGLFEPDLKLFERQLESLLAQAHTEFELIIAADGPHPDDVSAVVKTADDGRIHLEQFSERVGVHSNFARGLALALKRSARSDDLFAFCDQDDVWSPDKLREQVQAMQRLGVSLCHHDARIVGRDGSLVAPSMFALERRSPSMETLALLVMNSVTGMTAVFRKDVAEASSGFPMAATSQMLHDHWVALVASVLGEVRLLDRTLVDYVQHGANEVGSVPPARVPAWRNLLFGGPEYRLKCREQYAWRARALEALIALGTGTAEDGMLAYPQLMSFCLSNLATGRRRQAEQAWRLILGRFYSR